MAQAVTTPLVPSDYLGMIAPLTLGADLHGRIVERIPETADATTLVIRPGRGWRGHTPGQYVRIGVDVDGVRHWRAYSLTHGPEARGTIAITVKRIDGGLVSTHLSQVARPGDLLLLDQAGGDFTLPGLLPPKVLFVTAGSGITPVMGMLHHHLREPNDGGLTDVVVVHSAPTPEGVVFGADLRALAAEKRITLIERHTTTQGLLDLAELDALVPDWRSRQSWLCGPIGLLDAAAEHWEQAGITDRLHVERFRPTLAVVGDGASAEVTFTQAGVTIDAAGDRPILDSGEEAGVLMPSGCRMGICFGCARPLIEGTVRDLRTGDLTTAAPGDGVVIQTCISAPASACQIDL